MNMEAITKILFISLLFLSSAFLARSGEVDDESEFSYDENAENGPANWGDIHPNEWGTCKNGTMQSPIDLLNKNVEVVSNLGILQRYYKPSKATLLNRGHDLMLRWDDGGYLKINGIQYQLKQVHWHTPSEHTINGKRFDMEGHLVHETHDGKKIAVIGFVYEIGLSPDLFLSIIEKDLRALADKKNTERHIGIIDPNLIKLDGQKYYRYNGSLTVPPCTEEVVWTIDGKVKTVTRRQMKLLRDVVHDEFETNARPIQPLNGRPIKFNKPWPFA
ncbi:bifunctional monodehydroascorbate reductase and carbonic anhydrase nectarin-3-like [Lycium barbarum]|uniref:bifunctional monodehydroascorbate reductase and carbonic anhydrase nectarin-3-like n=1 Tax=Lycium barbarum TaxID=112863 RepID=UPI00293E4402|nr:bifunctional monodehydroascorbate reductase and carbonic anhydrase nectarin-3-like [Lycium barbarum]